MEGRLDIEECGVGPILNDSGIPLPMLVVAFGKTNATSMMFERFACKLTTHTVIGERYLLFLVHSI